MMKIMEKIFKWGNAHHPEWLFFLRAILGIMLFYKGYYYGQNANEIKALAENSILGFWSQYIIHYIVMAHLAGGLFYYNRFNHTPFSCFPDSYFAGCGFTMGKKYGVN